ncbi:hypothetical protein C6P91_22215 [Burkholderia multivorans]|nr:hypothetical protein C6P91_22215 [Burkholderia multivorans]
MALPFSVRSGSAIFSYCADGETFKKCPAELGIQIRRNHGVNCNAYRYQARITGSAFDTEECRWSDEWNWLGTPFDCFQPGECPLQEAKGNYDQFLDGSIRKAQNWLDGFRTMEDQIIEQGGLTRGNPPARLTWYSHTPLTYRQTAPLLARVGALSVYQT